MTTVNAMKPPALARQGPAPTFRGGAKRARRETAPKKRPTTTISLYWDTKEFLRVLGSKGETYDEIIRRLIRYAPIKEQDKVWNRILERGEFVPLEEV